MNLSYRLFATLTTACWLMSAAAIAEDWPTFQRDTHRSARTSEQLDIQALGQAWQYKTPEPPRPAWAGPAKWDAYARITPLRSMRNYDPVFHVTVVGDKLYYSSSADDAVHCLDTKTGQECWRFTTDGPVRITPTHADGKLYFGSDDGYVYCIDAANARLVWKHSPTEGERLVLNNGRFISFWPCRTGVLVDGDVAYFAASMLPWKESYLCAVNARTGRTNGDNCFTQKYNGLSLEGTLLATSTHLIAPQGRVAPFLFNRANGDKLGSLEGGGGCFALVTPDEQILHGPGNKTGWITNSNAKDRAVLTTFEGGHAMVVAGGIAYLLSNTELSAMERASNKKLWKVAVREPFAIIAAGDTLFVGGTDTVTAFSMADGAARWKAPVDGRAFGLAAANGALFVSTDTGTIHCFRAGAPLPESEMPVSQAAVSQVADVESVETEGLAGRWVFHRAAFAKASKLADDKPIPNGAVVKDQAGTNNATLAGDAPLALYGHFEALVLDGEKNSVLIAADHKKARLPKNAIAVEAWVCVDKPSKYGGILGAVQDNGDREYGWTLGYRDNHFSFAVATKGGKKSLNYLTAKRPYAPGQWCHVAGTYDGTTLNIYVDGVLENSATDNEGPINYPVKAFYEMGAYHDDDEYFRMAGKLHEVRLYERALSPDEIHAHYEEKAGQFPDPIPQIAPAVGPYLQFTGTDSALVRWQTSTAVPTILEYGLEAPFVRVKDATPKTAHEAALTGLKRHRVYSYVIKTPTDDKEGVSDTFECDTFFNYSVQPLGSSVVDERAAHVLKATGVRQGLCVVAGCGDGQFIRALASQSTLDVIALETDTAKVAAARQALQEAGVYGSRVSILPVASLAALPLPVHCANLVLSDHLMTGNAQEDLSTALLQLLRPAGGMAYFQAPKNGNEPARKSFKKALNAAKMKSDIEKNADELWAKVVRGPFDNIGEWSHQYGLADNAAFGGESLAGASKARDFEVQWLGRPGPRYQPDRNGRKPAPLAINGRLFAQGLQRMLAIDAYNGTVLWSKEIPSMGRFNMPRDCSNWCADEDHVYAAINEKCWRIDAATGDVSAFYDVVDNSGTDPVRNERPGLSLELSGEQHDWGYIARDGNRLLGSAVKKGTAFTNFWGNANEGWYDAVSGEVTAKVCSENLFALDADSGKPLWTYEDGLIINPTICVSDGSVYFIECRNTQLAASATRRVQQHQLWQSQYLVSLDVKTGKKRWEQHIDIDDAITMLSMACGGGKLAVVSSAAGFYHLYVYDAANGEAAWDVRFPWMKDNHGGHMARPAIVGDTLYVRPRVFDLATGKRRKPSLPDGGCGTYAASLEAVFYRSGNVTVWDADSGKISAWNRLRPDCWLSTIPACGMLLSPEAGGGCSCGNWLETSVGFMPKAW